METAQEEVREVRIEGYENVYSITDMGDVFSHKYGKKKQLKPDTESGYARATLCVNNETKKIGVHRLVALHFIPNPDNKPCVNHLFGKTLDNRWHQLEWNTHGENHKHAYDVLKRKPPYKGKFGADHNHGIAVVKIDPITGKEEHFGGGRDAARRTGINFGSISSCLRKRAKTAGGFNWRYKEDFRNV